jgi:hypothetical protein
VTQANNTRDPSRLSSAMPFSVLETTGALATIAAGTSTAGHLWAARFVNASGRRFFVTRLRAFWQTIAGPSSAAQEVALAAYKLTSYSAAHTGGAALTIAKRAPNAPTASLSGRIATTSALTAGTHTIGDKLLQGSFFELLDGATTQKGFIDEEASGDEFPVCVLSTSEGLLIRNEVLLGTGLQGKLIVSLQGYERS